ncbi:Allergen V5/Tpx-1-related protein [Metarhizium rileyi]|uniref:Allergen V5/Tpx-1-related protein n=1 Tax=Metarhizium rileyi (strain RCEF 4871) TaxID=1649241 RepID=A0A167CBG2_METRR|nr:Allergen V5/Tpx-1-related protein [Metarhizium rileyi RCEF 4871]
MKLTVACALVLLPPPSLSAVVTITVPPAIPSDEPQWKTTDRFTSAILNSTNFYRKQHNASELFWNKTLASFATDYLRKSDCIFEHSGGPYGENLAEGYPNATASVEAWGDERHMFDFDDARFTHDTGHFTQLVWKDTTTVGCGRRLCGESGWYLVCEYWPRGNVIGQFEDEVGQKISAHVAANFEIHYYSVKENVNNVYCIDVDQGANANSSVKANSGVNANSSVNANSGFNANSGVNANKDVDTNSFGNIDSYDFRDRSDEYGRTSIHVEHCHNFLD